jgi:deoxyribodipyrimidine photo-lyase
MINVVWLKRDLRVYDNPALTESMKAGVTIGVYCLSEWQWNKHQVSDCQRALTIRHLISIKESLEKLNVPLVLLETGHFEDTTRKLVGFVKRMGAVRFFFNKQYEFDEAWLESLIARKLESLGVQSSGYDDQCAIAPGLITNGAGQCYKVFSAFKRAFYSQFYDSARSISQYPKAQDTSGYSAVESLGFSDFLQGEALSLDLKQRSVEMTFKAASLWLNDETQVHQHLNDFVESKALNYKQQRDFPDLESTSHLSPYLAVGVITTRQCLQVALNFDGKTIGEGTEGVTTWINELIWREYYRHLLYFEPKLSKHRPFLAKTDELPWKHDQMQFELWIEGRTGFPIVDAAMRQLSSTGWMHNRLRMIVAMFLTKDLFIDWRLGETYFMENLIDGDLASNNGGWQWSASTGVDAAPYFRIFNPILQSKKFDPHGDFIRKFVPELADLDDKSIHFPTQNQRTLTGYPAPLVDHKEASNQTKAWFKRLKSSEA